MRKELSPKAKAFLEAADWLEKHEWSQNHTYFIRDGKSNVLGGCAVGALIIAVGEYDLDFTALDYIGINAYQRGTLINFNDRKGRTKEEVVAHLRELALTA